MTHRNDTMSEPAAAEQGQPDREERVKSTELKHLIDYMFTAAASDQVDATGCRSVYSGPTAHESRQTLPWDMDPTTVCQYPQQKPPRIEPLWAQSCMQFNTVRRQSRLSSLDALARRTLVSSGTQYCRKGASEASRNPERLVCHCLERTPGNTPRELHVYSRQCSAETGRQGRSRA